VKTGNGEWGEVITQRHEAAKNEEWGYTINPCPPENGDLCLGGFV